jgi:DNA replication protein DnaC
MSNLFQQMRDAFNPNVIEIPFDPNRAPRQQIEAAVAALPPIHCQRHPHELRPADKGFIVQTALYHGYPNQEQPHCVEFSATYDRCTQCPHSDTDHDIEVENCPVGVVRLFKRDNCIRDEKGRPLVKRYGIHRLEADRSVQEQFNAWLASDAACRCGLSGQLLRRRDARLTPPFGSWRVVPQFVPCLQCGLERLGITPDEARASFDNLVIDPPALREILEKCRAFAAAPKGVLLMLGNTGTGKTHLAIAILRELLRRRESGLHFIKHRHFLAQHWHALRPVSFGEEPPESPLASCQRSALLVYDEFTATTDNSRAYEDVLLDLFEHRNGHFKPSIITANVSRADLETALGSRLYDRLRRVAFAVLEFGFESKRPSLNADYLDRIRPGERD